MSLLIPYIISGTVKDSRNIILISQIVTLTNKTKSSNPLDVLTDSNGKYFADAENFNTGYDLNDEVQVEVMTEFKDESYIDTFIITGTKKTQNIQTEVIKLLQKGTTGYANQNVMVNVNNKPYTKENPFHVETLTDIRKTTRTTYTSNGFEEFFGEAMPGTLTSDAKWRISKRIYDSNDREISLTWASGNAQFDKIWDNRATYEYP